MGLWNHRQIWLSRKGLQILISFNWVQSQRVWSNKSLPKWKPISECYASKRTYCDLLYESFTNSPLYQDSSHNNLQIIPLCWTTSIIPKQVFHTSLMPTAHPWCHVAASNSRVNSFTSAVEETSGGPSWVISDMSSVRLGTGTCWWLKSCKS